MRTISIIFFSLIVTFLFSCNVAQQANAVTISKDTVVNINSVISGNYHVKDNSTLVFSKNGMFKNATIVGKNIRVVFDGDRTIFSNCNFSGATFVSSSLKATNFGMHSDMKTRPYSYVFKGYKINTNERFGTDNTEALKMLAQFLSNSNDIKIDFNGNFYSSSTTMFVNINGAKNLDLSGKGSLVMGLRLVDCTSCAVHDLNFVGFHTVHDFPPIYYKAPVAVNGTNYTTKNSYNCVADGLASCGLGDDAIKIIAAKPYDKTINRDFRIKRCHFEMRQDGLAVGTRSDKLVVRDVVMDDCTFDHIYFQPVALHVTGAKINNIRGSYCLQGLDISTTSNNVIATNSTFDNCCFGPKQESMEQFRAMSHHNVIDGCTFNITDRYMMLDATQYILNVSEGPAGDTFTVRNSTFNIKKNRPIASVMTRAAKTLLDNVTINVDITLDIRNENKYAMIEMFSVFGEPAFAPQLDLKNVTINIASGTSVYNIVAPHSKSKFNIKANQLVVNGAGKIDNYFENVTSVDAQQCNFNIQSKSIAAAVQNFTAENCKATAGTVNFVNTSLQDAAISITNSEIKAQSLVNCIATPRQLTLKNNNLSMPENKVVTGISALKLNSKSFTIKGNKVNYFL